MPIAPAALEGPIVTATGHRPKKIHVGRHNGYHPLLHRSLVDAARSALVRLKPSIVIGGMAEGWDTAVGEASLELDIPFWAYIPFRGQERRWSSESQATYRRILGLAKRIVTISEGGYSRWALERRDQRMVDDSNMVLGLWSGAAGGTADCVAYIEQVGRPWRNLYPAWFQYASTLAL